MNEGRTRLGSLLYILVKEGVWMSTLKGKAVSACRYDKMSMASGEIKRLWVWDLEYIWGIWDLEYIRNAEIRWIMESALSWRNKL